MANTYDGYTIRLDTPGTATTNYVDTNGAHATDAGRANGDLHISAATFSYGTTGGTVTLSAADHTGTNARTIVSVTLAASETKEIVFDDLTFAQRVYMTDSGANGSVEVTLK